MLSTCLKGTTRLVVLATDRIVVCVAVAILWNGNYVDLPHKIDDNWPDDKSRGGWVPALTHQPIGEYDKHHTALLRLSPIQLRLYLFPTYVHSDRDISPGLGCYPALLNLQV